MEPSSTPIASSAPLLTHLDDRIADQAWGDVIQAMDRTYAELVHYQEKLEAQNSELESMRGFLESVLSSVSDILLVVSRTGTVEQLSDSLAARLQQNAANLRGGQVAGLFRDQAALNAALDSCPGHAGTGAGSQTRPDAL
jgi:two-component system sensor histidine kinase HupT/HoxJ